MVNTIKIRHNGEEFYDGAALIFGCEKEVVRLDVAVNGSYNCNDFDVNINDITENWVSINRNRNILDIICDANTKAKRETYIILTHKLNRAIRFEIQIIQEHRDYTILVSDTQNGIYKNELEFTFDTLLDKTDNDVNNKTIYIQCENGKPRLSSIQEYAKRNANSVVFSRVKYDNGLSISIDNDNAMHIRNYGQANLYHEFYYKVKVKNKQDSDSYSIITIKFNNTEDNFSFK